MNTHMTRAEWQGRIHVSGSIGTAHARRMHRNMKQVGGLSWSPERIVAGEH
ncbi:MAG: hypothetical protein ACI8QZ_000668 [Chlamydiales bacterium]|jgi:hypothetical protein